jgi:hypothetical protein
MEIKIIGQRGKAICRRDLIETPEFPSFSIATHCMAKLENQDKRVSTWSANASKHFSHGAKDIMAQF